MPEGVVTTEFSLQLPEPVTSNGDRSKRKIGVERSAAPSLMVLSTALFTVTFNQPRAALLFIAADTVVLGLYFVVPPSDDERTHPIMSSFLRRIPDIFTAVGCALIVLGIGITFPNEVALIPLLLFISLAALVALFGMVLKLWMIATLYGAALVSLATFVVFAFMA